MNEYSEAEENLIATISPHWANVIKKTEINPPTLYAILARTCFVENREGAEIEALRRVCSAIDGCEVYRKTKEFDTLCQF